ncbi:MAG: 50S ribosomal protein L11 [Erysipelotrichia bacterium]|nr:50S ribosomal protein L11 [Erysipelotrichia bacterium]
MSKKVVKIVKLQFPAGGARPGPALAGVGVNMPQFCSAFNDATRDRAGDVVPVVITAFEDKSFTFELKTSPASVLLKKYAGVKSGSDKAHVNKVGKITVDQLREIATYKLPDLNANDVEGAMKIIAGTAKNMGIVIEGFGE